ncbi:3-hydroxybutyryl-CoA dehydrogenase [Streptomyces sp. PvP037]|jgi:3-hydroxybutyryl-CoA dehydrogenase|uniref:3-hydroxyacyl-CoA dehydrogenase family protein n=1 Tax=Streptomyces sp. PvP037 TaxID=3156437 RepID=UPI00339966C5
MSLPENVGVYGGGRMGAGIAHAFLLAGTSVTVVEVSEPAAAAARERVETSLTRARERGKLPGPLPEVAARLSVSTDPGVLAGCGLVVEAVPEDMELKRRVLASVAAVAPDAYLATNTSSLPVHGLASDLPAPDRLVGLHFFNPVPASELVEIVVGPKTAPELVGEAQAWVEALGKTAITVTDSPGFASSRLGVALALEAMRMLQDGVASAEDIDTAMTLGYKHPMGPLKTTDVVGLDVRLAIAEHLAREVGERFAPPAVLLEKVRAGHLGRKTGQGFYSW